MNNTTNNEPINQFSTNKPSPKNNTASAAYIGATWVALIVGFTAFIVGLFNADMMLNEKGYYFSVLMFGLFSAISVQKNVTDASDGLPVSSLFIGVCWICLVTALLLLIVGLWNAELALSEKGFYGMSFTLALFAAMSIQKNIRDNMNEKAHSNKSTHNND